MAERLCLALFAVWLVWLPLPFGSIVESARVPLVIVPLALCVVVALLRLYTTRDRTTTAQPTFAWCVWCVGSLAFLAVGVLQLIPLPPALLSLVSAESQTMWSNAARVAALAGVRGAAMHPITIDPRASAAELFRLAAIFATFSVATMLVRMQARRIAFATALCVAALFEALYGLREAALQRYEIWGWTNKLIFNRVTGTFVNPNHYAHYLAIVLPMALFILASAWRDSGPPDLPLQRRLVALVEHSWLSAGFAVFTAIACLAAILLASSRGALLALTTGLLATAAMLPGRRVARVALAGFAGLVLLVSLIFFLGPERTVGRFMPTEFERQTLVGRRIGIAAAAGIWNRFPLLGSGLGTFERVVSLEQTEDLEKLYHHAHNDYAEIAATAGTLGFTVAGVVLLGGLVALVRLTFGNASCDLTWRRRAFQVAAIASLLIAAVHALFDFNLFIPSNPATLAAIAGAAVATIDHDKRKRR